MPNESVCFPKDKTLSGFLTPDAVTVTVAGGVPEPASWLLMLVGVGGVGSALRSRALRSTARA